VVLSCQLGLNHNNKIHTNLLFVLNFEVFCYVQIQRLPKHIVKNDVNWKTILLKQLSILLSILDNLKQVKQI